MGRRRYTADFKRGVVVEAMRGDGTVPAAAPRRGTRIEVTSNRPSGKGRLYDRAFFTGLDVDSGDVAELADCARWKIENETFNVLNLRAFVLYAASEFAANPLTAGPAARRHPLSLVRAPADTRRVAGIRLVDRPDGLLATGGTATQPR